MSILTGIQLVVVVMLLVSVAESFRARPWWPRPVGRAPDRPPARGSAPSQRRWVHGGLALVLVANAMTMELLGEGPTPFVAAGLLLVGVAGVLVGLVRRPSATELARYEAEMQGGPGGP